VVNIAFLCFFAVFDPSPLTVCINCSFFTFTITITYSPTVAQISTKVVLFNDMNFVTYYAKNANVSISSISFN